MTLPIHCLGDSHAAFFSGNNIMQPCWPERSKDRLPFFRSYRLGPSLAYNLIVSSTTSCGRETLHEVLRTIDKSSSVMLVYGEIDCRAHLITQSRTQRRPIETVVENCIRRYAEAIHEVQELGFQVLVWGVIPSAIEGHVDAELPVAGTCQERNHVTGMFNDLLAQACKPIGVPVISIVNQLIRPDGTTNPTYYEDWNHLNQTAMPIALRAIREVVPELKECIHTNT